MGDAVATVALETFRDLLVEEAKFISGVRYQVKQVESDLRTMHALLIDADKWSSSGAESTRWMADLKNLASQAENVLEKYAVQVASKREGRNLKKKLQSFACILRECFRVHEVGKEIEGIRSRFAGLTQRLESMSSKSGRQEEEDDHLLRMRYEHEVEQHFVGMEKDIKHLVSILKNEKSPVISIFGMGGLGKTTLARKIFHHREVKRCFGARAWVCVTQQFQAKNILSRILKQLLPGEEINNMGQPELVDKIHKVVMETNCLIVIDDIWEVEHWNILKPAFAVGTNSKLVLTTRNQNIASQECAYNYKLDFLTEDQGWELLHKIALLHRIDDPDIQSGQRSFEDIGREMVQKCGRLPLAISVIGGILRQKQTLGEWEKVNSNIDSYLMHGEGVERNITVTQVLDLSYNALPYYLKPCFLYLGCFPEDYEIKTKKLYLLWIAEGLISSQDKGSNETLRDVAERYLTELAFRCMVQVKKDEMYAPHNKYKSCRLHDLMHDLCSSKAEEDNFVKRITFPRQSYDCPSSFGTCASRIAICVDDVYPKLCLDGIPKSDNLISFLVIPVKESDWRKKICFEDSIIDLHKSQRVRILVFDRCGFEGGKLPRNVEKLIHLRYLGLFRSSVEKLPLSICNMPYLHTLDLRADNSIKLPNVICKMKRLRHLFLDELSVVGGDKLSLDGLRELETLGAISSDKVRIADIPKLINLRELDVRVKDMESVSIIGQHMSKHQLRRTRVCVESCASEEGRNGLYNILMSDSLVILNVEKCKIGGGFWCYEQGMCKNLVKLRLDKCVIGGDDVMETLGKFPMLRSLVLSGVQFEERNMMICGVNSFQQLMKLRLSGLTNLKKWEVEKGAMPQLTHITVTGCTDSMMNSNTNRFLSDFETIKSTRVLDDIPNDMFDELGQDYYKINCTSFSMSTRVPDDIPNDMFSLVDDEPGKDDVSYTSLSEYLEEEMIKEEGNFFVANQVDWEQLVDEVERL